METYTKSRWPLPGTLPKYLLFGLWTSPVNCYEVLEGDCS